MRQIALDTETTGIGHESGHKIIEIGCVELIDRTITGRHFHVYLNPQRQVDEGAYRVHGISTQFLQDKPLFSDIVDDLLEFIADAELIIHNAAFDVGFLNAELAHIKWHKQLQDYCKVTDTLSLARAKHPGQRNNLDALCKRYDVDNSNRQLHGALLDAEILALVYLAMTGGQGSLFAETQSPNQTVKTVTTSKQPLSLANPIVIKASEDELQLHQDFIKILHEKSGQNHWAEAQPCH